VIVVDLDLMRTGMVKRCRLDASISAACLGVRCTPDVKEIDSLLTSRTKNISSYTLDATNA
jgi:hypothetical protein